MFGPRGSVSYQEAGVEHGNGSILAARAPVLRARARVTRRCGALPTRRAGVWSPRPRVVPVCGRQSTECVPSPSGCAPVMRGRAPALTLSAGWRAHRASVKTRNVAAPGLEGAFAGRLLRFRDRGGMIRVLKASPERNEGRQLGEGASPEGLIASFRTRVVAEPAL